MVKVRARLLPAKQDGSRARVWVVDYFDHSGKRRSPQFPTKKEADRQADRIRVELSGGLHTPDTESVTLAEAAEAWVAASKRGRDGRQPVEPTTWKKYRYHVDLYIVPRLGRERVSRLTRTRVAAFRDDLLDDLSRPLARKVLSSLNSILRHAVAAGWVARNSAEGIRVHDAKREAARVTIPARAEMRSLLAEARARSEATNLQTRKAWSRFFPLIVTAALTGLRPSELRGLPRDALDLKRGQLRVYQRADEYGTIGPPKSAAGNRTIMLAPEVVTALRTWLLAAPNSELVFPNWQGSVESLSNLHKRAWGPLQIAAGIADPVDDGKGGVVMKPRYSFYALRHFRASSLIAAGLGPKDIQVEMGHSSIQMTYDIYGHLFPDDDAARRDRAAGIARDLMSGDAADLQQIGSNVAAFGAIHGES